MSPVRGLDTRFPDDADSTGLLLWQVTNSWQAAQRAALKPLGLTHVQFVLLAALTWLGDETEVSQQNLADYARTDPMMTSQVLRALEGQQLLQRNPHPADRRAKLLSVTDAGRELVNRAVVVVETCDAEFFASLGSGRADFTTHLRRLVGR